MDPTASFRITATDETAAAIRSAAHNLHELERPIRDIRLLSEALLGGFGFSKLAGAFEDAAKKAKDMGTAEAQAVLQAQKAVDDLGGSLGDLEVFIAAKLAPSLEKAAKFWTDFIQQGSGSDARINSLNEQILALSKSAAELSKQKGGAGDNFLTRFLGTDPDAELARVNKQLAELVAQRDSLINEPGPVLFDGHKMQLAKGLDEVKKQMDEVNRGFEEMARNEQILDVNALKLTVDKTPMLLQMPRFEEGIKHMKDEVGDLAKSLGKGLHDSLVGFIVSGEASFKDFLKRLAAEVAISGLFDLISGGLAGSTGGVGKFFSTLFGGGRAGGGPVSFGKSYLVGERGPEIFTPGTSGRITPAGAGPNIYIYNQVGLPQQWTAQLAAAGDIAAQAVFDAVNMRMNGKR
jgi:hypothetical protein